MIRSLPLVKFLAVFAAVGLAVACEPAVSIGPASAPQTSRMQMSKDGKTLYIALADHDLVRAVDAATGRKVGEVSVLGYPHRLTVLDDGRVAVTSRYAGTVSIVNVEKGTVDASVDVGSDPFGVLQVDNALLVAVGGEGDLAKIDLKDPTRVASRIVLGHDDPRGLAKLPDGKIVVTHFTAGVLSVVDNDAERGVIDMHLASKGFFFPNQMESVTASVDGSEIAVPHVECNNDPAQFGSGGTDLSGAPDPAVTYYVDGPTGYPAVVPAVSHADPVAAQLLSDEARPLAEAMGQTPESEGAVAPVINPLDRQLLVDQKVNGPTEVAYVDGGKLELVVNRGSGNVVVRRTVLKSGQSSIIGYVDIGVGAESIQVSPDGAAAFVYNAFDDSVTSFAVPHDDATKSRFAGGKGSGNASVSRPEPLTHIAGTRFTVAEPVLPSDVLRGRVMFYAVDDNMTRYGAIACQSCHPGGAADGTTWHFVEGPRQSPPLWGGILGTEPFHWDGSVANMAGISPVTIQGRMGGNGLAPHEMNLIGAFLDQIPATAAPKMQDAASVARGEALFYSEATGCASCHAGASFTDNKGHDVGTTDANGWNNEFQTPVLHGLAHSAPYLHDGSAITLRDVINKLVVHDKMGHGSQLQEQDKDDLVAFLRTL